MQLSWNGFTINGDTASISEVIRLVNNQEQIKVDVDSSGRITRAMFIQPPIEPAQRRLIWSLYGKTGRSPLPSRFLTWASSIIGREIASFNDLTYVEANKIIDVLKEEVTF